MHALPALALSLGVLGLPAAPGGGDVVLLRQGGISSFEEVTEGFTENCRVRVRQVPLEGYAGDLRRRIGPAQLVVAVGQAAAEAAGRRGAQVVYALAPEPPPGAVGADAGAPVDVLLRALREARPTALRVGVFSGRRGQARLQQARAAARALGMTLVERAAEDGPQAILALRDLAQAQPPVDALWIGADPGLVTTPVFQYALQLQLQRGLPVLATTRQQVRSGAFLAADWPPRMVGRRLAALVNLALDGVSRPELSGREDPAGAPQVSLNGLIARKMGVDVTARVAAGWRLE